MHCVAWSATNAYQLAAGSDTGQLRLWDVRRAGPIHAFDAGQAPAGSAAQSAPVATRHAQSGQESAAALGGSEVLTASAGHKLAHHGAVTGLLQTPDGQHWMSAGADNAVRLWDAQDWHNCLVRYPEAFNSARAARQLALDDSGQVCMFRVHLCTVCCNTTLLMAVLEAS